LINRFGELAEKLGIKSYRNKPHGIIPEDNFDTPREQLIKKYKDQL